jgi:acetylornithine deacetylase/succinyl-diaminopimelate desuccinylase family protein
MVKEIKTRLFKYIDSRQSEIIDFLCELIELKPINPVLSADDFSRGAVKGDEFAAQNWIKEKMRLFGFDEVDYWANDPEERRPNVVGTIAGKAKGKSLILNGHVDVVPVPEEQLKRWTCDPYRATKKNGMVYGRGSCDMLGGLTAIIWAAKALLDNIVELKGDLYVESVTGEESNDGGFLGTATTITRGYKAPFAIVAEPTGGEIHTCTCGTMLFEMIVHGVEAHTAMKNLIVYTQRYGIPQGSRIGVDAVAKAVKYIIAFQEMEKNWNFRWRHPVLGGGGQPVAMDKEGVGIFCITPTMIEGGTSITSIPAHCRLNCQVYYPSWINRRTVWAEVKKVISGVSDTDDWLKENPPTIKIDKAIEGDLEYIPPWDANEVSIDHQGCKKLASAWEQATGRQSIFSGFKAVCDVTHFGKNGIPAVVFGPGNLYAGVHGADECISMEDIVDCCKAFIAMVIDWCEPSQ